jgi:hypothetical protein
MTILETALCNLKDEVKLLGYFNRFYEYAETIRRGNEEFPQVYIGNGQYNNVFDFDVNGSGYFRKNGQVRTEIVSPERSVVSCSDSNPLIDLFFPLRAVVAVPKKKLNDNSFSDDMLAFELLATIGRKQAGITGVQSVSAIVVGYMTDRDRIWQEEVRGVEKLLDLNLSIVAVDFLLRIRANLDCLPQNCNY